MCYIVFRNDDKFNQIITPLHVFAEPLKPTLLEPEDVVTFRAFNIRIDALQFTDIVIFHLKLKINKFINQWEWTEITMIILRLHLSCCVCKVHL